MTAAAAPRPRRISGRSLVRKLLKQPGQALHYDDVNVVPIGARPVLDALAELVARSGPELVYSPDISIVQGGLARLVALSMRAVGAESEIDRHLDALCKARLIVANDDGVRLVLPPEPEVGQAEGPAQTLYRSPGRRPIGMTDAQWADVVARHRRAREAVAHFEAAKAGQGTMMMVIPGGPASKPSDIPADILANISNEDIADDQDGASAEISDGNSGSHAAAAASTLQSISGATAAAVATREPADIPNATAANISPGVRGDISTEPGEAEILACELINALGLRPSATKGIVGIISGWIAAGADAQLLRQVFSSGYELHRERRARGERGISSANWFARRVGEAIEHRKLSNLRPTSLPIPANTPVAPNIDDPRVTSEPSYAAANPWVQAKIVQLLDLVAQEPSGERRRLLSFFREYHKVAFRLVAERHPELAEMFGDEPISAMAVAG